MNFKWDTPRQASQQLEDQRKRRPLALGEWHRRERHGTMRAPGAVLSRRPGAFVTHFDGAGEQAA
ncbi:hypothetical protein CG51_12860 [Haematobacter missouriensis]|uniref:Uncharacterized protein n=1 Tax=Haematobacter missouriensis TaxID=366616 RepID=A0A212AQL3_9RHOB|nr:hypothetical protein CG51_12860 [Haematobacter missouriensis]OWJ77096.1 hypothetical protein CDV53_07055 [Haematobacter missouriensis]OWJ83735.1 hypothetical protein CDV52_10150 [Haematobacter missouriensis]